MLWTASGTDVGQKRRNNQDVGLAERIDGGALLLVCDGMGGEAGGAVASELAARTAMEMLRRDVAGRMDEAPVRRVLECAGAAANAAVFDAAKADPALSGMGTTLIAAVVLGETAHLLHAGDSRAYLLRGGLFTQLTVDHTVVQMLVDRGEISPLDAVRHPQRHYITRAVGVSDTMSFDIFSIDLRQGDTLLLCSDGLYNFIPAEELGALTARAAAQQSVRPLIDRANQNGGGDNITAVLCGIRGQEAAHG